MNNLLVTGVVTIIGAGNIENLNLLQSRVGGLKAFRQELSDKARDRIYWLGVVGILTREIPKFVIQVSNFFKYKKKKCYLKFYNNKIFFVSLDHLLYHGSNI